MAGPSSARPDPHLALCRTRRVTGQFANGVPEFLFIWVESVPDPEAVGERTRVLVDARGEGPHPPGQVVSAGMAMVIGDVLAQPAPKRLDGHQIRAVAGQRHEVPSVVATSRTALAR